MIRLQIWKPGCEVQNANVDLESTFASLNLTDDIYLETPDGYRLCRPHITFGHVIKSSAKLLLVDKLYQEMESKYPNETMRTKEWCGQHLVGRGTVPTIFSELGKLWLPDCESEYPNRSEERRVGKV